MARIGHCSSLPSSYKSQLSRSRFLSLALPSGAPFVSSGHFERPGREKPVEASNRFSG